MFWPNFPKCARKLFMRQTFPDKFFCSSWLLINSHKLKHEVTPKKQFVDFMYIQCVFYDIINFYLRAQKQKCLISLILLKNVGTSVSKFFEILPDFSTNQTLLRVRPQLPHHWSKVLFKLSGTKETLYATYNFSKFFLQFSNRSLLVIFHLRHLHCCQFFNDSVFVSIGRKTMLF